MQVTDCLNGKTYKLTESSLLFGQQIGQLVIESFHHRDGCQVNYWVCRCVCGQTKVYSQSKLKSGKRRSCGCLNTKESLSQRGARGGRARAGTTNESWKGAGNPRWKGGETFHEGYRYVLKPEHVLANDKGYVLEHRMVAADTWGLGAIEGMDVHHINEDKLDNRPENLQILSKSDHVKLHRSRK